MGEIDSAPAQVKYLYAFCKDIPAMRHFYSSLLGMKEQSYRNDPQFGWLAYDCGGISVMFFREDKPMPLQEGWAIQPGGGIGEKPYVSWSVRVPEARFRDVVAGLTAAGVPLQAPKPDWRQESYWGFTTKDPMGNTVEVYCTPQETPASKEWVF